MYVCAILKFTFKIFFMIVENLISYTTKRTLCAVSLLFIVALCFGQKRTSSFMPVFLQGEITYVNGTVRTGLVMLPNLSDDKVIFFREGENAKRERIKSDQLKYLVAHSLDGSRYAFERTHHFESIEDTKYSKHKFWRLILFEDAITLYYSGLFRPDKDGNVIFIDPQMVEIGNAATILRYFIKREGQDMPVFFAATSPNSRVRHLDRDMIESSKLNMSDFPELVAKIESRELTHKNIPYVISLYNEHLKATQGSTSTSNIAATPQQPANRDIVLAPPRPQDPNNWARVGNAFSLGVYFPFDTIFNTGFQFTSEYRVNKFFRYGAGAIFGSINDVHADKPHLPKDEDIKIGYMGIMGHLHLQYPLWQYGKTNIVPYVQPGFGVVMPLFGGVSDAAKHGNSKGTFTVSPGMRFSFSPASGPSALYIDFYYRWMRMSDMNMKGADAQKYNIGTFGINLGLGFY
jgi:hypothetical protein